MPRNLAAQAGALLRARGWTLATAESCTGGLLGHLLTQVPGSSDYYLGGVVAYSNAAKQGLLGVAVETLNEHGAVSAETARAMARGATLAFAAAVGISTTGIAGPGGGSPAKPVGLTYIGLRTPEGEWVQRHQFEGRRASIKQAAARAAMQLLLQQLRSDP